MPGEHTVTPRKCPDCEGAPTYLTYVTCPDCGAALVEVKDREFDEDGEVKTIRHNVFDGNPESP